MKKITIKGWVKEIRIFGEKVILFVQVSKPTKVTNKTVRFVLTEKKADPDLINWAELPIGSEVTIEKTFGDPLKTNYHLSKVSTNVIDAEFEFS